MHRQIERKIEFILNTQTRDYRLHQLSHDFHYFDTIDTIFLICYCICSPICFVFNVRDVL